jgi:hypothetical protein
MIYGAARKATQVANAKVTTFSGKEHPMFFTDKVLLCASSGIMSVYMWPLYLYWDVRDFEAKMRNIDIEGVRHGDITEYFFR